MVNICNLQKLQTQTVF